MLFYPGRGDDMLSTPDSVIVFIMLILVILTVMFVAMFVRNNPRVNNRSNRIGGSQVGNVQSGARINTKDATIARRLDPSAAESKANDPRGADIGGNYNK
jgi:hypothetical protein